MINLFLLVTASTLFFTGISLIISYLIYKKAETYTSKATGLAVSSFLTLLTFLLLYRFLLFSTADPSAKPLFTLYTLVCIM